MHKEIKESEKYKMEIIDVVLLCILTFTAGFFLCSALMDNTYENNLREELNRQEELNHAYQKERDNFFDKYCEEVEKNKNYKLWIYEHIRDKRSE